MSFHMPPRVMNAEGRLRRVGFELEFAPCNLKLLDKVGCAGK